jgi:hypothetical protein
MEKEESKYIRYCSVSNLLDVTAAAKISMWKDK